MIRKVNLDQAFSSFQEAWSPKIVGELNGQHVKLARFQGPFTWHRHEREDELFLVIHGRVRIELRDGHVDLEAGELTIVPRGVEHRPVAEEGAQVLMFEPVSTLNTGDTRNEYTVDDLDRI